MVRSASAYERELKDLLQGESSAVTRYARGLPPDRRPGIARLTEAPFLVIRGAGSLGFDLIALRNALAFPLEVKASRSDTIRFSSASGRAATQLAAHRAAVERVGLFVLYAYRRVGLRDGETWRLFVAAAPPRDGRLAVLRRWLPPVDATAQGNAVLRWADGMPLSEFLEKLEFLTARPGGPGL
ncbi:MAG: Holliday junction resolvase [Thermoplasmata archaeon]